MKITVKTNVEEEKPLVDWNYVKTHPGIYCNTDTNPNYYLVNTGKLVLFIDSCGCIAEAASEWSRHKFVETDLNMEIIFRR